MAVTGIAHDVPRESSTLLPTALVILSCFCFGTIPYFAKTLIDSGMASYSVAFYRYGLSALILMPLLWAPGAQLKTIAWGILSGVSVGLGWIGFVYALRTVPVSTVGVLYMTYPVFTLIIGWIWFRDLPSRRAITAALIVIMAAMLASSPAAVDPRHLPALLVSLSAPISFGFGINVLIHKLTPIKPIKRVATFSVGASLSLLPLVMLAAPGSSTPQSADGWWLVAGLALGTALLPQLLYVSFAPMIGAARSAMAGSVELPTMFIISWFMLGESIGLAQWISCLLITLAILMTPASRTRNLTTQMVIPPPVQKPAVNKRLSDTWF